MRWASLGIVLFGCLAISCSEDEERPPAPPSGPYVPPVEIECEPPLEPDTSQSCGKETVQLFGRKPTIYFILDVSGSMAESIPEGSHTKLDAAKTALGSVVGEIGHRINYGLATFPGELEQNPVALDCAPGEEIFPVVEGDPLECTNLPARGPVFSSFARTLRQLEAGGGTPLSPTLNKLAPTLLGNENSTAIILITDGAPNCNEEFFCEAEDCDYNRYGASFESVNGDIIVCDEATNCCDSAVVDFEMAHLHCVDEDASVAELTSLRKAGIPTYVIGVLGLEEFDDVMNQLAVAGGRPRDEQRKYYDVESLSALTDTVRQIGRDLTQTCEIALVDRPLFANELNVYFDGEVVPSDGENGWTLEEDLVTLNGKACDQLTSGEVDEIQMVSGCQTIVR